MGLRRWIAGVLAFGLTAGLAAVFLAQTGWSLEGVPVLTWLPWAVAIVVTGLSMQQGWPLFLITAAGLLFVATLPVLDGDLWVLPLLGSTTVLLGTRLSGLGWMSQWGAKGLGAAGLLLALWELRTGLPAEGSGWVLLGLAAGLAVLGLWPRAAGED